MRSAPPPLTRASRRCCIEIDRSRRRRPGQLAELAAAIRVFHAPAARRSSPTAGAHQSSYYLAAQADEVYVDPLGSCCLHGYERYRLFFKDALDKLGIDINVFRVGTFKSAEETFTRTRHVARGSRGEPRLPAGAVERLPGRSRRSTRLNAAALAKYVDLLHATVTGRRRCRPSGSQRRAWSPASRRRRGRAAPASSWWVRMLTPILSAAVSGEDYLRVAACGQAACTLTTARPSASSSPAAKSSTAASRRGPSAGTPPAKLLRDARIDTHIKAVVLRIDSPGGSVLASEQIYRECWRCEPPASRSWCLDGRCCRLRRLLHLRAGR